MDIAVWRSVRGPGNWIKFENLLRLSLMSRYVRQADIDASQVRTWSMFFLSNLFTIYLFDVIGHVLRAICVREIFQLNACPRVEMLTPYPITVKVERAFANLILTSSLQATNPRDSIYGLLGVVNIPVCPNYTKSVGRIFSEVARLAVSNAGLLEHTLEWSGITESESSQRTVWALPSWVPEWNDLALGCRARRKVWFDASTSKTSSEARSSPTIVLDDRILKVHGVMSETVLWSGLRITHDDILTQVYHLVDTLDLSRCYITGIPYLQAIFRTILFDTDPSTFLRLQVQGEQVRLKYLFRDLLGMLMISHTVSSQSTQGELEVLARLGIRTTEELAASFGSASVGAVDSGNGSLYGELEEHIDGPLSVEKCQILESMVIIRSLKFFQTSRGYLGLGPPSMAPGDLVCMIFDCKMPILLRRVDAHYLHVGTCFVLGLMDGEGLLDPQGRPRPTEVFEIH